MAELSRMAHEHSLELRALESRLGAQAAAQAAALEEVAAGLAGG